MNVSFFKEQIGKLPAWSGVLWHRVSLSQSEAKPSTKHPWKAVLLLRQGFLACQVPQAHALLHARLDHSPRGYPHSSTSSTKLSQQFQLKIREWAHSKKSTTVDGTSRTLAAPCCQFLFPRKQWRVHERPLTAISFHSLPLLLHNVKTGITHAAFLLGAVLPLMPVMASQVFNWLHSICYSLIKHIACVS